MNSGDVQIGSIVISDALFITIVSIVGPFLGSLLAIIITHRTTLMVEKTKWNLERKKEYREQQREAVKVAMDITSSCLDASHKNFTVLLKVFENLHERRKSFEDLLAEFQEPTFEFRDSMNDFYIPAHIRMLVPEKAMSLIYEVMLEAQNSAYQVFQDGQAIKDSSDYTIVVTSMKSTMDSMRKLHNRIVELQLLLKEEYEKTFE